jgi:hypothetical protein
VASGPPGGRSGGSAAGGSRPRAIVPRPIASPEPRPADGSVDGAGARDGKPRRGLFRRRSR